MGSENKKGKNNRFQFVSDLSNLEEDIVKNKKEEPQEIELLDLDEEDIVEEIKNSVVEDEPVKEEISSDEDTSLSLISDDDEMNFLDATGEITSFIEEKEEINKDISESIEEPVQTSSEESVLVSNDIETEESSSYKSEVSENTVIMDPPRIDTDEYSCDVPIEEDNSYTISSDEKKNDDLSVQEVSYSSQIEGKTNEENVLEESVEARKPKVEVSEDKPLESFEFSDNTNKEPKKIYFSFQTRIVSLVVAIIILIGIALFLILSSVLVQEVKEVEYKENVSVNYKTCLITDDPYDTKCIDSLEKFKSADIDEFKTKFKYEAEFAEVVNYNLSYHVVLVSRIYDKFDSNNVVYEDEDVVVDKTKVNINGDNTKFDVNVDIDYKKYNDFVIDYIKKYSSNSEASLDVILYVDDNVETRKVASLNIPLVKEEFKISNIVTKNENQTCEVTSSDWTEKDICFVIIGSVLVLISILLMVRLTKLVMSTITKKSSFETELQDILNTYDRLIVVARDGYATDVIMQPVKVGSFEEILNIRERLNKPIIYSKVNNIKSEFIVEDEDKIYKYVMKEADIK